MTSTFTRSGLLAAAALLLGVHAGSPRVAGQAATTRPANAGSTASVSVTIRVLPYVSVSFDGGQTAQLKVVGNTRKQDSTVINGGITTNMPVTLTPSINPPAAMGGDTWEATIIGSATLPAGTRSSAPLLRITVTKNNNSANQSRTYTVSTGVGSSGTTATATITADNTNVGTATITIAPN